ncbi:hypothetical protein CHELA1G11_20752 [Hyphomicrobiales bacterium]|nr:hypothetical protein CHELA1G11_20752 [Hyphomicrobiales bacterium]CAH1691760.1 hypothetical protein CHELA1G2_21067 [Hyphomicrobiales bacterium]
MNKHTKPPIQTFSNGGRVLISGASIAGPALAYWLQRYGFSVTVIERSETIRPGGYPIDLRWTAMLVAERMGLKDELFNKHIQTTRATFVDGDGSEIVVIEPELIHGAVRGRDVELPRGELTSLLFLLTRGRVSYRFKTSIAAMDDQADGVKVTFADGLRETYDLVIGADGVPEQHVRYTRPRGAHLVCRFERNAGWRLRGHANCRISLDTALYRRAHRQHRKR